MKLLAYKYFNAMLTVLHYCPEVGILCIGLILPYAEGFSNHIISVTVFTVFQYWFTGWGRSIPPCLRKTRRVKYQISDRLK